MFHFTLFTNMFVINLSTLQIKIFRKLRIYSIKFDVSIS